MYASFRLEQGKVTFVNNSDDVHFGRNVRIFKTNLKFVLFQGRYGAGSPQRQFLPVLFGFLHRSSRKILGRVGFHLRTGTSGGRTLGNERKRKMERADRRIGQSENGYGDDVTHDQFGTRSGGKLFLACLFIDFPAFINKCRSC